VGFVQAPGWLKELRGEHVPETEEYGISSFVFRATRPFHPARLAKLLYSDAFSAGAGHASKCTKAASATAAAGDEDDEEADEEDESSEEEEIEVELPSCTSDALDGKYGFCVRSKGTAWIAGGAAEANAFAGEWSHSGRLVGLSPSKLWYAAVDKSFWPSEDAPEVWDETPGVGDRRTEVVVIGMGLRKEEFGAALAGCLLTDEEFAAGPSVWASFPDPLWGSTDWAELRASLLEHEHEHDHEHEHEHDHEHEHEHDHE
jgi:G3E family GTPase